jgi:hypothetical protein
MPAEVVDPQGPVDQSSADTEVLPACFAEQAGVFSFGRHDEQTEFQVRKRSLWVRQDHGGDA